MSGEPADGSAMPDSPDGSVQQAIEAKLRDSLAPSHLEVINESHMHSVPPGSESHFRVIVVSELFEGQSLVERHRSIYEILADEMAGSIHALGLQTHTPAEWSGASVEIAESPECLGGSKDG